jgi:hypothetical protein
MQMPDYLTAPELISEVERQVDHLLPERLPRTITDARAIAVLSALAHEAYRFGKRAALAELLTSDQAAETLGVTRARVLALARSRSVGWRIGRDVLFRPEDIAAMRERTPGRPRKA